MLQDRNYQQRQNNEWWTKDNNIDDRNRAHPFRKTSIEDTISEGGIHWLKIVLQ